ncbi:hypothetical protein Dsin_009441 [Dipteronia sinensis]|uniref:Ribosomal protein S13 n=1 Tax=Dipteronia sinensis TaxID=43782 RepID=A0AAE0AQJ9_9ROSI|nr:hypothetical protein Dsin_009441 [Dipteronia sinensis]
MRYLKEKYRTKRKSVNSRSEIEKGPTFKQLEDSFKQLEDYLFLLNLEEDVPRRKVCREGLGLWNRWRKSGKRATDDQKSSRRLEEHRLADSRKEQRLLDEIFLTVNQITLVLEKRTELNRSTYKNRKKNRLDRGGASSVNCMRSISEIGEDLFQTSFARFNKGFGSVGSRFRFKYLAMIGFSSSVGSLSNISQRLLQTISFRGLRVQCLRVGNTEIPNDKKLEISLQHVYGIGRSRAHQILCDLSIGNKLTKDLTGVEFNTLREEVSRYMTGEDLRRCIKHDIGRLVDIQCYRGIRHSVGLPCRGQRTSTNARTRKGKRVAIPGKKKPTR